MNREWRLVQRDLVTLQLTLVVLLLGILAILWLRIGDVEAEVLAARRDLDNVCAVVLQMRGPGLFTDPSC